MKYADKMPCPVLYRPDDPAYDESIRQFQGCPTIATTDGGRIYLGWYSGGVREPDMRNYNLLIYSDDKGKTWSKPLIVIPSDTEHFIHALDIQLFTDPKGTLHVCWVQNNTEKAPEKLPEHGETQLLMCYEGYMFNDFTHAEWEITCEDPDAAEPVFSAPRSLFPGFMRCKPLFLTDEHWLCFAYNQTVDTYCWSETKDGGKTYVQVDSEVAKIKTYFDEAMAYVMPNGDIRFFARCWYGRIAEMFSRDGGKSWGEAQLSDIVHADTRFFVSYTPSGKLILVTNDCENRRTNMTVYLSEDGGATFPIKRLIDDRDNLSYPDIAFADGRIYLTYDRDRNGYSEIFFLDFTEDDLMNPDYRFNINIVSKPPKEGY